MFRMGSRDFARKFDFAFRALETKERSGARPAALIKALISRRDACPWRALPAKFDKRSILPEMGFFMQ